jgi:sugar phosphate permease
MGLCFVSHLNRLAMSVAGTERLIPEHNLAPERMGWVYSAFLAVYTLGMILGGWCIDRWGPRAMLVVMGLGSALFGALTGALGFGWLGAGELLMGLLVIRGLMGLFTTPLHPACARVVSNWFPTRQRAFANGLVTFAAVVGMAATYPVFGALMDWLDWPGAFLVAAGMLAGLTLIWGRIGRDRLADVLPCNGPRTAPEISDRASGRSSLGNLEKGGPVNSSVLSRGLILLALSYAAVGYFQYLFFYWSEFYFKDVLHLSVPRSRAYTTFLILALGVGMPIGGWLSDRAQAWHRGQRGWALVPGSAMALSAAFLFLGVAAREPFWIVTLFALAMFALGGSESSFWQAAVELGGARGGTAAAIINTGGNGVGLLAPLLTPVISAHLGWHWGISVGGVVGILGALCWMGIDPSRSTAPPTPQEGSVAP